MGPEIDLPEKPSDECVEDEYHLVRLGENSFMALANDFCVLGHS